MSDAADRARAEFARRFAAPPQVLIRAPGRVNLIGDHTDYSEGFVLPIAIDRAVWLAARRRRDRHVRVWAELPDTVEEFDLDALAPRPGWQSYMEGVAAMLIEAGHDLPGFDAAITTDLPTGAGLSSSAALELATARAFADLAALAWDPVGMAVLCQRAENEWVGMNCGIMDQLISAVGRESHAMLIDCRTLGYTPTPLPDEAAIVVLDTGTRRKLVTSAYNERRASCEEAARAFGVPFLRDLSMNELEAGRQRLSDVVFRRARHVLNENALTLEAADALRSGDLLRTGELMKESHASLRDDYEVTTEALDKMAELAAATDGCFGARMTGAGFGGSVVALVAKDAAEEVAEEVLAAYEAETRHQGAALHVKAARGAAPVA